MGKVYCANCRYHATGWFRLLDVDIEHQCMAHAKPADTPISPYGAKTDIEDCYIKNANNDCMDFEERAQATKNRDTITTNQKQKESLFSRLLKLFK